MAADLLSLPGGDLVETGLHDLGKRLVSDESLLVSIGRPRLVQLGLDVPVDFGDPERRLYGRYNALGRRLVSFERALARTTSA